MVKVNNYNNENGEYLKALEQASKDVDEILKTVNKKHGNSTTKDNDVHSAKDIKQFSNNQINPNNEVDKNDSKIKIDLSYLDGEIIEQKIGNILNSDCENSLGKSSAKQNRNTPLINNFKNEVINKSNEESESSNEQREQIRTLMIALEKERELHAKSERTARGIKALALVALIISIIALVTQITRAILLYYL